MGKMAALLAAAAILALAQPASAQSRTPIAGVWSGLYGYTGSDESVEFQMRFTGGGAAFQGSSVEVATFGNRAVLFLTANVTGGAVAADGGVRFTKTYDGTGDQTHSVQYDGKFDAGGKCIAGEWRIGATKGPFEMCTDARMLF